METAAANTHRYQQPDLEVGCVSLPPQVNELIGGGRYSRREDIPGAYHATYTQVLAATHTHTTNRTEKKEEEF